MYHSYIYDKFDLQRHIYIYIFSNPTEQLWTEKYKPKKISEIIGNKEMIKRIDEWLKDW